MVAVENVRCASSEVAMATEVLALSSLLGGQPGDCFDLKEDELVSEEEAKVEPDAAPHLAEFEQERALQRWVSLMISRKGIRPWKKKEQLASQRISSPIVPLVDGTHIEE